MSLIRLLLLLCALCAAGPSQALTVVQAKAIASGDNDERISALNAAVAQADAGLATFVQALLDDAVKVAGERAFIVRDGKASDAATGAATVLPDNAEDVVNNNRMRRELEAALA